MLPGSPSKFFTRDAPCEDDHSALRNVISPFREMLAYEILWSRQNQTLRTIADLFKRYRSLPSELLKQEGHDVPEESCESVSAFILAKGGFSISIHGDFQYPERLRSAKHPIELFYYKGDVGLLDSRCVSVVGTRNCSAEGRKNATEISKALVRNNITIVSGLATGIDTAALTAATEIGGQVVGVIGTPIDEYYPKENKGLQDEIAEKFLLISQVPFFRYAHQPFQSKRNYFPQRNETMSALSEATVIVEASDTSGTLSQGRACLEQGRKLLILGSCFRRTDITWPRRFEKQGAIRVSNSTEVLAALGV